MFFFAKLEKMLIFSALWQLFDKKFVDAVLQEWYKTMMDLPAGLRQAYEMVVYFSFIVLH